MMPVHDSQFSDAQTGIVSVEAPGLSHELFDFDTRQAITLYQVGKMVTAGLDLEATLEAVTEAIHHLTGADTTALALMTAEGSLVLRFERGSHRRTGETLDIDHGVTAAAIRERQPRLVADMHAETNGARSDPDAGPGVRTFLAVPLIWLAEPL